MTAQGNRNECKLNFKWNSTHVFDFDETYL